MYGSAPTRARPRRHAVFHWVQPDAPPRKVTDMIVSKTPQSTGLARMMGSSLNRGMNYRRRLLVLLGAATFTPQTLFAQSKKPPAVIGWLYPGSAKTNSDRIGAFSEG